jgi:hypothetical protein
VVPDPVTFREGGGGGWQVSRGKVIIGPFGEICGEMNVVNFVTGGSGVWVSAVPDKKVKFGLQHGGYFV